MKTFKKIDSCISLGLILYFVLTSLGKDLNSILTGYLVVGCWQMFSMCWHYFHEWHGVVYKVRRGYYHFVFFYVLFFLTALLFSFLWPPLVYGLLFAPGIMAIFYTCLCFYETLFAAQRPLHQLK